MRRPQPPSPAAFASLRAQSDRPSANVPFVATRRRFLQASAIAAAAPHAALAAGNVPDSGERPRQAPEVKVLNPRARVPVSFIIDDSTALVNVAHFCIPQ